MTRKKNATDLFEVEWAEHVAQQHVESLIETGILEESYPGELTELAVELIKDLEEGETL